MKTKSKYYKPKCKTCIYHGTTSGMHSNQVFCSYSTIAEDAGGGIGWYHLDVFCNSHQEALNAGVGYKKVYAITTKYKKKRIKVKVPIYEKVR